MGACSGDAKTQRCTVALTHAPATPKDKPANWSDTLVVVSSPAGWKVDDVVYDPNFAFGNTGKLSEHAADGGQPRILEIWPPRNYLAPQTNWGRKGNIMTDTPAT